LKDGELIGTLIIFLCGMNIIVYGEVFGLPKIKPDKLRDPGLLLPPYNKL
jgi:hypothetical protein